MNGLPPTSAFSIRACPALRMAGLFAGGVLCAEAVGAGAAGWAGAAVGCAATALLAQRLGGRRLVSLFPLVWSLLTDAAVFAGGGAAHALRSAAPPGSLEGIGRALPEEGVEAVVTGRIRGFPSRSGAEPFRLHAELVEVDGHRMRLSGGVLARPRDGAPRGAGPLRYGQRVRLRGRLLPLPRRRNPADFDYGLFLRRQDVHAVLARAEPMPLPHAGAGPPGWQDLVGSVHLGVSAALERYVSGADERAVLSALVLGDRSGLDREAEGRFARTGLMHLLAVSGLHVLLVGMLLYELLRPLLARLRLGWLAVELSRAAVTLGVLLLYTVLTGASASVVRAVVMAALLIGGVVLQRRTTSLNALGVAALVVLAMRPAALFEAGFQLSFAAVAGIVRLGPVLEAAAGRVPAARSAGRLLLRSLSVSAAASVATLPVLLYQFGQAPLIGLALNLPAIPVSSAGLAAGLLTGLSDSWWPDAASMFGAAAGWLAWLMLQIAAVGDRWTDALMLSGFVREGLAVLALAAAVLALAAWPHPRRRWRWVGACLLLAAGSAWRSAAVRSLGPPLLEVLFFDVGQGDAALLTFPNGRRLLVDAGVRNGQTDAGLRTILPHLDRFGIRRLDAVVVSHPHADHLGGVPALLAAGRVGRLFHNGQAYASELRVQSERLADSVGAGSRALVAGDTLFVDPAVRIQVLHPRAPPAPEDDPNEGSLVLRVVYGRSVWLLTGDAEGSAEDAVLGGYAPILRSQAVKVGHHGSRTSSGPAFVSAARTPGGFAVVSVARRNRYGLPDEEVVERWRASGARVLLTSSRGAVRLASDGRRTFRLGWR